MTEACAAGGLTAVPGAGGWPAVEQGALVKPFLCAEAAWLRSGGRAAYAYPPPPPFSAQAARETAPAPGRAGKRRETRWQLLCG